MCGSMMFICNNLYLLPSYILWNVCSLGATMLPGIFQVWCAGLVITHRPILKTQLCSLGLGLSEACNLCKHLEFLCTLFWLMSQTHHTLIDEMWTGNMHAYSCPVREWLPKTYVIWQATHEEFQQTNTVNDGNIFGFNFNHNIDVFGIHLGMCKFIYCVCGPMNW